MRARAPRALGRLPPDTGAVRVLAAPGEPSPRPVLVHPERRGLADPAPPALTSRGGPLRSHDPAAARRGADRDRPLRRGAAAAVERRRPRRPLLPRLPQRA